MNRQSYIRYRKTDIWDYIKLRIYILQKKSFLESEKASTVWKKILTKCVSNKGPTVRPFSRPLSEETHDSVEVSKKPKQTLHKIGYLNDLLNI